MQEKETKDFIYVKIAADLQQQIQKNLLRVGDKLPSLRSLSREQGISIGTAYKTYVELENMGLIQSRSKSGYYVAFKAQRFSVPPSANPPLAEIQPVNTGDMVQMVFKDLCNEEMLQLSLAAPATQLRPVAQLHKSMLEALRQSNSGNTQYELQEGHIELRKQIARRSYKWGGNHTENDIITTHGCMEALLFCLRATTSPGDIVAIESPAYFGVFNILQELGLRVLEIPVDAEQGLDIDYLSRQLEKVKISACIFISNFNNPTGACITDQQKQELVNKVTEAQIPLIENDIYGEIYFGESRPRTCKSFDTEGWVLLCSSISKSVAPGYRVGWCIPGRFREKVLQQKMICYISSATPTQAAISKFFESGRYDKHIRSLRKALHTQSLRYSQSISTHFPEDTKISQPQGGYSLWIELDRRINAFDLYQASIKQNISIAPGQIFSADGRFANFIRVSFGIPFSKAVDQGFETLGRLISEMLRK